MSDKVDNILRPTTLNSFVGQENIINQLKIHIYSAKKRNCVLNHILFYGPPGLGKTTLANIIANEMNSKIITITAISIEKISDLVSLLGQLEPGDILFIDEMHRLKKEISEVLYSAMEDFKIFVTFKNEENTKVLTLNVSPFTLIGATTNAGGIAKPLLDRFSFIYKFNFYTLEELQKIINNNSNFFSLNMDESLSLLIAKRTRNTPRYLNNILRKLSDYKTFYKIKRFDYNNLIDAFKVMNINDDGLTEEDIEIIKIIGINFANKPQSLETISSMLNEDVNNIRYINEPYLVMANIILRTKRGRMLSEKGLSLLNKYKEVRNFN